jgi:hypothetical protein
LSTVAGADEVADAKAEIRTVIEASYINGAFNALDADAMRAGFHEDFAIFWADGEKIGKYPIATWADGVEKKKADPGFDPAENVWDHELPMIDVTGGTAMAKVELSNKGRHVYTDYLLLLKFESGWRIVAKVYKEH